MLPDHPLIYLATIALSAIISMYAVRKIIFITTSRRIFDIPDNIRKIHGTQIASLGGIGIFAGYLITAAFFMHLQWYYVVAATILLFFTGIYDDIMNMRPVKKLLAQLIASCILVFMADVRITSLYGIAGIWELAYPISAALTILSCTFFINVFNFMDGIDGLACALAILYTGIMAVLFVNVGDHNLTGISLSLLGATIGLLRYNAAPARIYMGDTGSMLLGFTIFALTISCVSVYTGGQLTHHYPLIHSSPSIVMVLLSVLFLPICDAIRVFILRLSRGISPLRADRTHLHYYLLDAGLTHNHAVLIITAAHLLIIATTWLLQDANPLLLMALMTAITTGIMYAVYVTRKRRAGTD
jgi:UDP-GlcNAc:undecaprenyl-phosphate/decaprenyl-phosphate GlcNAc-1-phosphate transferase